ncbi:MAG: sulfite exporter TauE/SafE family protein [Christensenellaceae bacterium]|jgi:permease|nr:sulfite exporter TauE/SafE family protein [Christensenellaceae bacterium]
MLLALTGLLASVLAGMGLGGGVLLIPALTLFFNISQKQAQLISLITYIPMALTALVINVRKKNIRLKNAWLFLPAGALGAVTGALIAKWLKGDVLKIIYAVFLIVFGLFMLVRSIAAFKKGSKDG